MTSGYGTSVEGMRGFFVGEADKVSCNASNSVTGCLVHDNKAGKWLRFLLSRYERKSQSNLRPNRSAAFTKQLGTPGQTLVVSLQGCRPTLQHVCSLRPKAS